MGRQVLLIVGPPGSGKSTLAAASGLTHLERESFRSDADFEFVAAAEASRSDARVAVVACCPSVDTQVEWEDRINPTRTVVLDVPLGECIRRLKKRGNKNLAGEVIAAKSWHEKRGSGRRDGYGPDFVRDRKLWVARVSRGGVRCRRCGDPIDRNEPWDLGHDDFDRSLPTHPEHRACNRATAGRRTGSRFSRRW